MLIKLMKHEFKATKNVFFSILGGLIGVTLIGMLATYFIKPNDENSVMAFMYAGFSLVYILATIALLVASLIILIVRFYKTMYANQGYLTHTLPASPMSIVNSKLFVSVIWYLLSLVITSVCILGLFLFSFYHFGLLEGEIVWGKLMGVICEIFEISSQTLIIQYAASMIVGAFSGLLMAFASLSIGQLFNKHKVAAAIVTYVIFYIIIEIISTISSLVIFDSTLSTSMTISLVQSTILAIIFYVITVFLSKNHLNLD